jgi:hypothetical protein
LTNARAVIRLCMVMIGTYAPWAAAQDCPARQPHPIRPSLLQEPRMAGSYRAPWEFVCGAPLRVRVDQSGARLTATVQAPATCDRAGQVRWSGSMQPGAATFPVRATRGASASTVAGIAAITDLCTVSVSGGGPGASRFVRTDSACASETPRALVVFIGGAFDNLNHNLLRVFCAYDAAFERTRKLYYPYTADLEQVRADVLARAGGVPVMVVGHSYGGETAYRLAQALDSVAVLVTLDPVGPLPMIAPCPAPPEPRGGSTCAWDRTPDCPAAGWRGRSAGGGPRSRTPMSSSGFRPIPPRTTRTTTTARRWRCSPSPRSSTHCFCSAEEKRRLTRRTRRTRRKGVNRRSS